MDELTLSIGDLARRTGVDIPTLRRWERYEGLLTPDRTPGGQRRYGAADVSAVEELVALIGKGWAAASAARAIAEHRDTGAIVFDASLLDAVPAGVVVANAAGEVLYANPAIAAMLGSTKERMESRGGGTYLDEENQRRVADAFRRLRQGERLTYEVRMHTEAAADVDAEVAAGPLLGPGGQYRGVIGVFRNLERTKAAEQRAARLGQLVDASEDAMIAVDRNGIVLSWNPAAVIAYDLPAPDAVGRPLLELLPSSLAVSVAGGLRRAFEGEPSTFQTRGVGEVDAGERRRLHDQIRVVPLNGEDGAPDGAIVMTVDVSGRHRPGDESSSAAYHGVVAALTQSVLAGDPASAVVETAVRGVARALDASHVAFVESARPTGDLVVLASTAEEPASTLPASEPFGSHIAFSLQSQRPITVQDFEAERRFDRGPLAGEQAARSGVCVPVRWQPDGRAAIAVHCTARPRTFGPIEVTFVQSAANVCALALQGRDGANLGGAPVI
ncbi:MAG TPA: PAS domain-containing protein [Acidimicrobiales bacterium]|nr:PAS domain-containing protein [Acidimicrobiales bacterium]